MKQRKVKKLDPRAPLIDNAARILRVRVGELSNFAPAALEPGAAVEQHDMRIAAKRVRYVLEATEFCFGRPAADARKAAKALQEVLGEIHDCDVMLPRVAAHAAELRARDAAAIRARAGDADDLDPVLAARAPHRTAYRGLGVLAVHLETRRDLLFERFVSLWEEQQRSGVWRKLDAAIERRLEAARERREAAERARSAAEELAQARRLRAGDG